MEVVNFINMADGTAEEYALLDRELAPYAAEQLAKLPGYMATLLHEQQGNALGYRIDRFQHSLQTATRAFRDGADEETVVCALLHDVGDGIGVFNHSEFIAALMRPFVSARNHWVLRHHGLFQGYYYFHHMGGDRNARDRFRGHEHYQACVDFCEKWDQCSFDPEYDTMPFKAFEPMIGRMFAKLPSNGFI